MAAIETQSVEQNDKVSLRVLVHKERNRVLYAEAGKDFVDVLFSFLTLPLGTIARLVAEESNIEAVRFGSISSLYQSVSDLDQQYVWSLTCKEMLLKPKNSMVEYCQKLKLNIDDTEPWKYFMCDNWDCIRKESGCLVSLFRNIKCNCGKLTSMEVFATCSNLENGFVKENYTLIICEDLCVMPNSFGASLHLLQKLGVVVDLLKLSLISKAPLTDFILKKNQPVDHFNLRHNFEFLSSELPSDEDRQMSMKVTLRKSNEQILFVEAEDDFADFVFSFLTFPLGGVLHMLQGFSSLSCIDNLYKSMTELSPDRYLMSEGLKEKLTMPLIAAQYELSNQILPIGADTLPINYCHTYPDNKSRGVVSLTKVVNNKFFLGEKFVPFKLADPKSSIAKSSFVKGPSIYMVTDDLFVTPMSSISAMSYINRLEVPLSDLEERVIKIGVKEGLSILKASLISTSALTYGLKQFIRTIKMEK